MLVEKNRLFVAVCEAVVKPKSFVYAKWKGGRGHAAVTDDRIPVAVAYTSASLHDSQDGRHVRVREPRKVWQLFSYGTTAFCLSVEANLEFMNYLYYPTPPPNAGVTYWYFVAAVTVTWQPVDGALYYRVYRGTRTGEAYAVENDTTTETSYADEGGAAGKTYYYSVKAVGASTESGFSAFASGKR